MCRSGAIIWDGKTRFSNLSKSARASLVKLCFILYSKTKTLFADVLIREVSNKGKLLICVASPTRSNSVGVESSCVVVCLNALSHSSSSDSLAASSSKSYSGYPVKLKLSPPP